MLVVSFNDLDNLTIDHPAPTLSSDITAGGIRQWILRLFRCFVRSRFHRRDSSQFRRWVSGARAASPLLSVLLSGIQGCKTSLLFQHPRPSGSHTNSMLGPTRRTRRTRCIGAVAVHHDRRVPCSVPSRSTRRFLPTVSLGAAASRSWVLTCRRYAACVTDWVSMGRTARTRAF